MKVSSSMMKEIEYHPHRSALLVMFNDGKIWEYSGVRVEIWQLLTTVIASGSVSVGRAFHYLIKIHPVKYPARHIPGLTTTELTNGNVDETR